MRQAFHHTGLHVGTLTVVLTQWARINDVTLTLSMGALACGHAGMLLTVHVSLPAAIGLGMS